jgi:hypothetical protein
MFDIGSQSELAQRPAKDGQVHQDEPGVEEHLRIIAIAVAVAWQRASAGDWNRLRRPNQPQNKHLRAWLDDQEGMTRNDVSDLVLLVFESVATCLIPSPA